MATSIIPAKHTTAQTAGMVISTFLMEKIEKASLVMVLVTFPERRMPIREPRIIAGILESMIWTISSLLLLPRALLIPRSFHSRAILARITRDSTNITMNMVMPVMMMHRSFMASARVPAVSFIILSRF